MSKSVINDVLLFNQNLIPCHYNNLYLQDIYSVLTNSLITDGYFFMQWLFPVQGVSKWHTHTTSLTEQDVIFLQNSTVIKNNILTSAKFILSYFKLTVEDNKIYQQETLSQSHYWLSGIGHEEKKLSRIMLSLKLSGFDELAAQLQKISIQILTEKGFKTGKNPTDIIEFWKRIFDSWQLY